MRAGWSLSNTRETREQSTSRGAGRKNRPASGAIWLGELFSTLRRSRFSNLSHSQAIRIGRRHGVTVVLMDSLERPALRQLGWFSNRTGTSDDDWRARGINSLDSVPIWPYFGICSRVYLRPLSSSEVSFLLLSQPFYKVTASLESLFICKHISFVSTAVNQKVSTFIVTSDSVTPQKIPR